MVYQVQLIVLASSVLVAEQAVPSNPFNSHPKLRSAERRDLPRRFGAREGVAWGLAENEKFAWARKAGAAFVARKAKAWLQKPPSEGPLLLICVVSAPNNFRARSEIRKWFRRSSYSAELKLMFAVGWKEHGPGPTGKLAAEQGRHGDLLQLETIEEGYFRLSVKVVAMFAAAQRFGAQFVMKVDDDVRLIKLREIVRYLHLLGGEGSNTYIGRSMPLPHVPLCRPGQRYWCASATEHIEIKRCAQKYLAAGIAPRFMVGGCYILGQGLVRHIAKAPSVRVLLEDVNLACALIDSDIPPTPRDLGCHLAIQPFATAGEKHGERCLADSRCDQRGANRQQAVWHLWAQISASGAQETATPPWCR
jgi:hypothetical protein